MSTTAGSVDKSSARRAMAEVTPTAATVIAGFLIV